jgi:hypothetical protein
MDGMNDDCPVHSPRLREQRQKAQEALREQLEKLGKQLTDLKPRGVKAPLNLLPLRPLQAIAAVIEHGAVKYAPWNWQDPKQRQAAITELYAALLRHTFAASDPSEPDIDEESGLHHMAHAGACVLILLYKLGQDYQPSKLLKKPQTSPDSQKGLKEPGESPDQGGMKEDRP